MIVNHNYNYIKSLIEKGQLTAKAIKQKGYLDEKNSNWFFWLADKDFLNVINSLDKDFIDVFSNANLLEDLDSLREECLSGRENIHFKTFKNTIKEYAGISKQWNVFWKHSNWNEPSSSSSQKSHFPNATNKINLITKEILLLENSYNESRGVLLISYIVAGFFMGMIFGSIAYSLIGVSALLIGGIIGGSIFGVLYNVVFAKSDTDMMENSIEIVNSAENISDLEDARKIYYSMLNKRQYLKSF